MIVPNKRYVVKRTTYCFVRGDIVSYFSGLVHGKRGSINCNGWTHDIKKAHHYTANGLADHMRKSLQKGNMESVFSIQIYMTRGTSMYI